MHSVSQHVTHIHASECRINIFHNNFSHVSNQRERGNEEEPMSITEKSITKHTQSHNKHKLESKWRKEKRFKPVYIATQLVFSLRFDSVSFRFRTQNSIQLRPGFDCFYQFRAREDGSRWRMVDRQDGRIRVAFPRSHFHSI